MNVLCFKIFIYIFFNFSEEGEFWEQSYHHILEVDINQIDAYSLHAQQWRHSNKVWRLERSRLVSYKTNIYFIVLKLYILVHQITAMWAYIYVYVHTALIFYVLIPINVWKSCFFTISLGKRVSFHWHK